MKNHTVTAGSSGSGQRNYYVPLPRQCRELAERMLRRDGWSSREIDTWMETLADFELYIAEEWPLADTWERLADMIRDYRQDLAEQCGQSPTTETVLDCNRNLLAVKLLCAQLYRTRLTRCDYGYLIELLPLPQSAPTRRALA